MVGYSLRQIKFNSHHNNLFNFTHSSMLATRLLSKLMALNVPLGIRHRFATATAPPNSLLQAKILSLKSFNDFCQLYEQKQNEINGDILGATSRHIVSLISVRDQRISFEHVGAFLAKLQKLDLNSLPQKTIISLLSILRSLRIKGFTSTVFNSLKGQLTARYCAMVKQKRSQELELNELINAYNQMCYFKCNSESRLLAGKIANILQEGVAHGRVSFNNFQTFFLLHCLSIRSDYSPSEIQIRQIILRRVTEQLSSITLNELVRVAVSLNRMEFLDFSGQEFSQVRLITNRIFESVNDLQENSIYELIRGDNNSRYIGFYRIYEEIIKNLFAQISPNGKTDIQSDAIFRMLAYLADKIALERLPEKDQIKFFTFLRNIAQDCSSDEGVAKSLGLRLHGLVSNGFFSSEKHKRQIVKIIVQNEVQANTNLLYEMATKGYDVSPLAHNLDSYDIATLKEEVLLKVGIIMHRIPNKNQSIVAALAQVEQRVAEAIATPKQFLDFIRRYSRYNLSFTELHSAFGKAFEALPNPFATAVEEVSPLYRVIYFNYLLDGLRSRDFLAFTQTYDAAISLDDVASLISHQFSQDNFKGERSELNRPLLFYVARKIYSILDAKHKRGLELVIDLLSKYSRFAIYNVMEGPVETALFKTLHLLINRVDVVNELGLTNQFFNMIEKYLSKNHRRYNIESQYRSLVRHVLSNLQLILSLRPKMAGLVLSIGLRLNLLNKRAIQNVDLDAIKNINYFQRSRANHIKDRSFTPNVERITQGTLTVILSNSNFEAFIAENEKKIIDIIQSVNVRDLCTYLIIYAPPKSIATKRILSQILNKFVEKSKTLETLDLVGVFQNALESNFFHFSQFRKITEKAIEEYSNRVGSYSVESHMELIKFIISQTNLNPRDYYTRLADYIRRNEDTQQYENLLVRLASTNHLFKEEEIACLDSITRRNMVSGVYYFLMLQNQIQPEACAKFVREFAEKYGEWVKGKNSPFTFNAAHYKYLKKKYPEQTASLNLTEQQLHNERMSIKPRETELVDLIVRLSGGNSEELTDFGPDNYFLKIKDYVVAFLYSKKAGSYYEHEFIKRAVSTLRGQNLKTIIVQYNSNHASVLEYIHKSAPSLFNEQEFLKTVNELKEEQKKARAEKKAQA